MFCVALCYIALGTSCMILENTRRQMTVGCMWLAEQCAVLRKSVSGLAEGCVRWKLGLLIVPSCFGRGLPPPRKIFEFFLHKNGRNLIVKRKLNHVPACKSVQLLAVIITLVLIITVSTDTQQGGPFWPGGGPDSDYEKLLLQKCTSVISKGRHSFCHSLILRPLTC